MAGGEAGSKVVRLVSFLGAGVICTAAINMWRDLERKSIQQTTQVPEKASKLQMPGMCIRHLDVASNAD